jgi:uncharacterized membrane protein
MRKISAFLIRSFIQGLILICPIAVTAFLLFKLFAEVDNLMPYYLVPRLPRGLGFLIIISFITVVGYLGTRFFVGRWLFDSFAYLLEHTPGVKHLYTTTKEMMNSFVGEKKKFNQPVWICINANPEVWRIGFVTQNDMGTLGFADNVAVYVPQAYAVCGWVLVTHKNNIRPVVEMTSAEAMKFAVSGGITSI